MTQFFFIQKFFTQKIKFNIALVLVPLSLAQLSPSLFFSIPNLDLVFATYSTFTPISAQGEVNTDYGLYQWETHNSGYFTQKYMKIE